MRNSVMLFASRSVQRKPLVSRILGYGFLIVPLFLFVLVGIFGASKFVTAASAPLIINYQGRVLANNQMVSSTLSMKLLIYDASTNGSIVYTAAGTTGAPASISVTPTNGFFSVNLGDVGTNSIDPTIFKNYQNLYLEVQIGAETLTPRKQLTAAAYAFNATYLDGVGATSTAVTSTYIPISDSGGNFNLNNVTTTKIKLTNGILWGTGNYTGVTNTVPNVVDGPQLMWIPEMAAFRAGYNTAPLGVSKWGPLNIGSYSASFGNGNYASGDYSFSTGFLSTASGIQSVALGYQATAAGVGSVALGGIVQADGSFSFASGYRSHAASDFSTAIGQSTYASGANTFAAGYFAIANNTGAHAAGTFVTSSGVNSMAFGNDITVGGDYSIGFGLDTTMRTLNATNTFAVVGGKALFGTTTVPAAGYQVFIDGGTSANAGLGVNGYIKASGFITGTTTLDLAETYPIDPDCYTNGTCPAPGDVVCISNLGNSVIERCQNDYSQKIIGIISTDPGFTLGGLGDSSNRKVALAGRVPLKVSTTAGAIHVGDHLTSSDIPGVAKKAVRDGETVAIALSDYDGGGVGYITAFVKVGWSAPELDEVVSQSVDTNSVFDRISTFARSVIDGLAELGVIIKQGVLQVAELIADKITTKQLCVGSTCITETELQRLLEKNNVNPSVIGVPVDTSTNDVDVATSSVSEPPATNDTVPATDTPTSVTIPDSTFVESHSSSSLVDSSSTVL